MGMKLKDFYIRNDQEDFIKSLPCSFSEHIRAAIDDYIVKKKKERETSSPSLSVNLLSFKSKA